MKVDITYDNQYLVLSSDYIFELNVIRNAFTREIPNAWMLKKITSIRNTDRCFMNNYNMVPSGLWLELIKVAKENNIVLNMTEAAQAFLTKFQLDYDTFKKYVDETFADAVDEKGRPFQPYEYQIKAAYTLIRYRRCCGEISTSGGKTLISFIIFKYLIEVVGCAWDSFWNHGIDGKILAFPLFLMMKDAIKKSPYVVYVTKYFLQGRYPTKGKNINISNVSIPSHDDNILAERLKKIKRIGRLRRSRAVCPCRLLGFVVRSL